LGASAKCTNGVRLDKQRRGELSGEKRRCDPGSRTDVKYLIQSASEQVPGGMETMSSEYEQLIAKRVNRKCDLIEWGRGLTYQRKFYKDTDGYWNECE